MLSLFESYNARFVDPATVADTFVLREREFHVLCEQNNSLIVGPRGSGKTTLLKMLKVGAQVRWKNAKQAKVLRRFAFAPIYVGADRQFELTHGSLRGLTNEGSFIALISKALFASRVKFACLETLQEISDPRLENIDELSHQYLRLASEDRVSICRNLSNVWDFEDTAVSFIELKVLLRKQISEINKIVNMIRYAGQVDIEKIIMDWSHITHDPIHVCQSFIDIVNSISGQPEKLWALCIDELEIMPGDLQEFLFSCLRSTDQRIVLKLATSPFSRLSWSDKSYDRPMAGHDYSLINLSFGKKIDARKFSVKLLEALMVAEGVKFEGPASRVHGRSVLGRSVIEEANTSPTQRSSYSSPNGYHYKRFAKLQETDPSFRSFLEQRKINIDKLSDENETKRAGNARKYIWQVATRLEYGPSNLFKKADQTVGMRSPSRKRAGEIYLGYDSLITICEGNPRTIIGLLRPLVRRFTGTGKAIEPDVQAVALQAAIAKYFSLLSSIPVQGNVNYNQYSSVIELIDDVGEFLSDETNGPSFKAEPSLSIIIDQSTSPEVMEAIGDAMNQGAFVMLSDEIGLFDYGALVGARLRLSYLLCPRYHLPLTYGQSIPLSTILRKKRRSTVRPQLYVKDLFDASVD
uniref:ORC-CDC6 family AAA ATPase n=1 Tax=Methylobacterium sp. TaxID=409 RepID=UPI0020C8343C|nr:hypothetical protein [Methylobacterium sp.]USU34559.1 hypothetical protein NG677_23520 [Methylobacterium sp.]